MQLRQTELVRVLDDEGVDVGDVDAGLDDGGADQHLGLSVCYGFHHGRELRLVHLPVCHRDADALEELLQADRRTVDVLDAVVQIIDLAAALQLAPDGVSQHVPIVLHDEGLHREAILRGLLDSGHVADAGERHVERARDGRGREGQHVHAAGKLLDMLLVGHAEALLLVHDQQAEILELHVLAQQPVRSDHEIALAGGEVGHHLGALSAGLEAAEHADRHGEAEKALQRGLVMLLREHRSRHEDGGLLAVEHAFHHRAQGDLGLAEAHVSAEETVHRDGGFHVALDLGRAAELIVGLRVAEVVLKLLLPLAVRREGVAGETLALGIEGDELLGHVLRGALGAAAGLGPLSAAHFGELDRLVLACAGVFRHHVQLRGGHVERVRPGVLELDIVLFKAVHLHLHHTGEAADTVVFVYHVIAHREVGAALDPLLAGRELLFRLFAPCTQELGVCEHGEADTGIFHARRESADGDAAFARLGERIKRLAQRGLDAVFTEKFLQHAGAAFVTREDDDAVILPAVELHILRRGLRAAGIAWQLLGGDGSEGPGRHGRAPHGKGVCHVEREIPQARGERIPAVGKALGGDGDLPAFLQHRHVVRELLDVIPGLFAAAGGLIEKHEGVFRDVLQAACRRVEHGQIAVGVREKHAVAEPVGVGAHIGSQRSGQLAPAAAQLARGKALDLRRQGLGAARKQARQALGGRQDRYALDILGAALADHVEVDQGIHVVAPELDAHGLAPGGREEVENAAAAGKLTRPLHLFGAGIAAADERVLHVLDGIAAGRLKGKGGAAKRIGRHRALQQPGDGHGHDRRAVHDGGERGDAFLLRLAGGRVGRIEGEIAHAERHDRLAQQGAQVVGEILGGGVVRADDEERQAAADAQSRREIGAVDGGKPGNERRKSSALQQGGEGGGFLVFKYLID